MSLKTFKNYDLLGFRNMYPEELSSGTIQIVALIRILAIDPYILLLHEIFSSLDIKQKY